MVKWAATEQSNIGLDIITDGEDIEKICIGFIN